MRWLEITRGNPLKGSITIPGSKNSSLPLLAACCLCDEVVILKNIPNISDVSLVCDIAKDIGMKIIIKEDKLILDPSNINSAIIDHNKSADFRASYYFAGALLAKFKRVSIGYPGGDDFGSRPIDQHIKGLEALGAKFNFYKDYYVVQANKLIGADIYLDVISSGATINIMLAAVLAQGKTILRNAAKDPEVVDVAIFLNEMGAFVKGAGTDIITIEGVKSLGGGTHCAIPDRLIAGAYLMAAAITGGDIKASGIIPEHLISCTAKLEEAGVCIEEGNDFIRAYTQGKIQGVNVKATMYPGFATDLQQPLTALLILASSHSVIVDKVYPGRFNHCQELNRMGADIIIKEGSAIIPGNRSLKGAWVNASDVRAGISLILAGLIAEGTTYITGVEHIERGYVNIVKDFLSLGANIKLVETDLEENKEFDIC
ncbi:UDP-N-acetylglucosamine 1-carboxyvinyltransferase [Clostridium sp. FP2]|uniref:UDP-N-acetylglucosamine 1-carboxyvinyltransferase n=1 Tax=Clostridium sp. FP2 TaxID=2724481 RepID=UPI0013E9004F|nr:UDP-N-acetylglucosamine 1-carboxyvinyltransferase [Clostridium sp. FP2]MBZ9625226.1 UDP-N-acetylglucosamine 1-carboxyvinyltransferase [Clostridium sp. FP2]